MIPAALIHTALMLAAEPPTQQNYSLTIFVALASSAGFWSVVLFLLSRKQTERQQESERLTKGLKDVRRASFLLIDAVEGMLVKLRTEDGGRTWDVTLAGVEVDDIRREIRTARSCLYEGS